MSKDRGLRVDRLAKLVFRPVEHQSRKRLVKDDVRGIEGLRGGWRRGSERFAHSDVLRALAGKDKGNLWHYPLTVAARGAGYGYLRAIMHV